MNTQLLAIALLLASVPAQAQVDILDWNQTAKFLPQGSSQPSMGWHTAISGDTALVGSEYDILSGSATNQGSAYFFVRSGGNWQLQQKVNGLNPHGAQQFGASVAIQGDVAVIGAAAESTFATYGGAAYIFERSAGVWTLSLRLSEPTPGASNHYGSGVAIDGNTILVGCKYGGSQGKGAGYVYTRQGGSWALEAQLEYPGVATSLGHAVAMEGRVIALGAPFDNIAGQSGAGSVSIFKKTGGNWTFDTKLVSPLPRPDSRFGYSLAASGGRVLVGCPWATVLPGDQAGAAYIFLDEVGGGFELEDTLPSPTAPLHGGFTRGVSLSGDMALIGSSSMIDEFGVRTGGAFAYVRAGSDWTPVATLVADDGLQDDGFGFAVGLDGTSAVITSPNSDDLGLYSGSTYMFELDRTAGTSFCTVGETMQACPCGNTAGTEEGCANSGSRGAALTAVGTAAVSGDSVSLIVTQAPASVTGLFFSAPAAGSAVPFGDGLLCLSGAIQRLDTVSTGSDGTAHSLGTLSTLEGLGGGELRHYQFWYRDPASPCGSQFSTSSGYSLLWQ